MSLRKVSKLAAAAMAALLTFGLASCGTTEQVQPSAEARAKLLEGAQKKAGPTLAAGEFSAWDFGTKPNDGVISNAYKDWEQNFEVKALDGSKDATLSIVAGSKFKYLQDPGDPSPYITADKGGATLEAKDTARGKFELVLAKAGTLTMVVSGNGDAAPVRFIAVVDKDGKVLVSKDNLQKQPLETLTVKLEAGTYTIFDNGSRVHKISLK